MTEPTTVADLLRHVAAQAALKLPATLHERLGTALALVEQAAVVLDDAGRYSVRSEEDPTRLWPVNGVCTCPDATCRAPEGWCKHRLAAALHKRVQALLPPVEETSCRSAPAAPPLPEAPASVNVHLTIHGRQVQLTLRDTGEGRLLVRLDAVLQHFPVPEKPTETPAPSAGRCARHGVPMKENHKDGRSWWSHRTADGSWCKEKGVHHG